MFDPSFFSFGNGLFYNPVTDSVAPVVSTAKVKGREYSLADYENLKYEISNQTNILGVNHQASFSKSQDEIIDDMAKQLASYGVSSLADLKENKYTVQERDPYYFDDGEAPTVMVEKKDVINSKTGEVIPLNELNNAAGKGFTWYNIDFVEGQAVPYAWKEATGAGALGNQIQSIVSIPPVAAALTAATAGALQPTAKDIATSLLPDNASKYLINTTANALANAAATTAVTSAATGDLGVGLQAGGTVLLSAGLNKLKGQGVDALEDLTGLDLRPTPSTRSLLDTGAGDTTDQTFLRTPTPVTPSVTGGIPEVVVTAPPTSLLDTVSPVLTNLVNAPVTPTVEVVAEKEPIVPVVLPPIQTTVPDVVITGTRPTETDLVAPVIPGLLNTITITGTRPTDFGDVTVIGNGSTDLGSILTTATNLVPSVTPVMPTSETITPTVTVTGTPTTTVDVVAPVITTLTTALS